MSDKQKLRAEILSNTELATEIYDMRISAGEIADLAKAGQFLSLYSQDGSRLLPRPISICGIGRKEKSIRLVYRIAGKGTAEFSQMKAGMRIDVVGPLGNGFPLKKAPALIIGGGIGIPPMLELVKQLDCEKQVVLGYRKAPFLLEEFQQYAKVSVATEDGSFGVTGTVIDAINQNGLKADVIYACGPIPMLRAVKAYAAENRIECFVSLEERMACGIGACLGCVCKSKEVDSHTNVNNKRICKEGPVFEAGEVEF